LSKQTQKEWQIVFIICAIVYFIGGAVFWVFGQSDLQPWAVLAEKASDSKNVDLCVEYRKENPTHVNKRFDSEEHSF
jgi:hypothetical protein